MKANLFHFEFTFNTTNFIRKYREYRNKKNFSENISFLIEMFFRKNKLQLTNIVQEIINKEAEKKIFRFIFSEVCNAGKKIK